MKKLFTILATFAMLCAVGCEEQGGDDVNPNDKPNTEQPGENPDDGSSDTEKPDDGSEIPDDAYISINKDILTFSPDGESVDIKVYSNYEWTLTNNCDWVTTSIASGEASDAGVVVTLTADLTYDDREGTITFSCGKAKKLLVVSQSFKEAIIADENNTFNIPTEGGNVIIAYQTTVECEVIIPEKAQSWISIAPTETRALVSESATLTVAENTTYSKRSAIVKVVAVGNKSLVAEYTITQDSKPPIFYIEYTSTNGKVVTPNNADVFGASIVSNTYSDGKGVITFDGDVTEIGDEAFGDCSSLESITIPNSVTSIGEYAFCVCSSLTSITIPDGVTSIGGYAFSGCSSLTSITIPDSVTSIGGGAFSDCSSLEEFSGNFASEDGRCLIVDGVLNSFAPAGLTEYTIPNNVTSIGGSAFAGCSSLESVTIPDNVTSIGWGAFGVCSSLESITIPDSVTSIGGSAFADCSSLARVTIPDSVTSIGGHAFFYCESLTSITIPDSVTSIGDYAFCSCSSLASVYCKPTTPPTMVEDYGYCNAFSNNASGRKIYVPMDSVEVYKTAEYWSDYADSIVGYNFQQ